MRTRKAVINIIVGLIGVLLTTVGGLINSGVFARNLGVEISGLNTVLTNIIAFMSVTELGIAGAINYNLYKPVYEKDYTMISKIMTFYRKCYAIIGAVILGVSLVLSCFVHRLLKGSTLTRTYVCTAFLLCAANTVLSYYLAYNRNLLYVFQENYIVCIIDTCCRAVSITLQVVCLVTIKSFHVYLFINLFTTIFSNIAITIITRKRHSEIKTNIKGQDKQLQIRVFKDVKSLAVIQIGSAMVNYTSAVIISKVIGIQTAGMYAYYATLITMLTNIIGMIFTNLGAGIGNLLAENQKESVQKVICVLTHFSFLLGLIVASGLGNSVQPFIQVWVGPEYLLEYYVVAVLAVNFFVMVQRQMVHYFLRTGGYHVLMIKPLMIEAVINLTSSIFLGARYGLVGVFGGIFISTVLGGILNAQIFCRCFEISFKRYVGEQLIFLVFFIVQLAASQWFISSLDLHNGLLLQFIVCGCISVAIPLVVLVVDVSFSPSLEYIRQIIFGIGKKIFKVDFFKTSQ